MFCFLSSGSRTDLFYYLLLSSGLRTDHFHFQLFVSITFFHKVVVFLEMCCHLSSGKVSTLNDCLKNLADDIHFFLFFTKSIIFLEIHSWSKSMVRVSEWMRENRDLLSSKIKGRYGRDHYPFTLHVHERRIDRTRKTKREHRVVLPKEVVEWERTGIYYQQIKGRYGRDHRPYTPHIRKKEKMCK